MKHIASALVLLPLLVFTGCGPSEKNEGESWTHQEFGDWVAENVGGSTRVNSDGTYILVGDGEAWVKPYDTGREAGDKANGSVTWGRFVVKKPDSRFYGEFFSRSDEDLRNNTKAYATIKAFLEGQK